MESTNTAVYSTAWEKEMDREMSSYHLFALFKIYSKNKRELETEQDRLIYIVGPKGEQIPIELHRVCKKMMECSKKHMANKLSRLCEKESIRLDFLYDTGGCFRLTPKNVPYTQFLFVYHKMIVMLPVGSKRPEDPMQYVIDTLNNSQYPKEMVEFLKDCLLKTARKTGLKNTLEILP